MNLSSAVKQFLEVCVAEYIVKLPSHPRGVHWPSYGPDLERGTCHLSLFKTQLTKADKNVPCRGRFTEAGMSNSIKPFLR